MHVHNERGQCLSKVRYESRRQALCEIKRARSRRFNHSHKIGPAHHVYHCPHCGAWHVGKKPPKDALRRWRKNRQKRASETNQQGDAA